MEDRELCKRYRDRLVLYHYGELQPAEETSVREHLSTCLQCSAELEELVKGLQAIIFLLKEGDGMEVKKIAALFGISVGAVTSHLVRAVEALKKYMPEYIDTPR
jgi:DNA-directed RNA polymerase specialized sigma24 family protein